MRGLRDDEKSQMVHWLATFHALCIRYINSIFNVIYRRSIRKPSRDRELGIPVGWEDVAQRST